MLHDAVHPIRQVIAKLLPGTKHYPQDPEETVPQYVRDVVQNNPGRHIMQGNDTVIIVPDNYKDQHRRNRPNTTTTTNGSEDGPIAERTRAHDNRQLQQTMPPGNHIASEPARKN
jgi:hypothetical protein